jgi:carbon-monoxide dehydrogenase small subunit
MRKEISVTINNELFVRKVEVSTTLLRFIREDVGLTGTKEGCGAGECGACTILMDGKSVNSCMILAVEADSSTIETVEGEGTMEELSPIQKALKDNHAVQCGFCTPGMVNSIKDLLRRNPRPNVEEIKLGIEGNFCRCTGYQQIIEAVLDVTGQQEKKGGLKHV